MAGGDGAPSRFTKHASARLLRTSRVRSRPLQAMSERKKECSLWLYTTGRVRREPILSVLLNVSNTLDRKSGPPTLSRALRFPLRLLHGHPKKAPTFLHHVFLDRIELCGFPLANQLVSLPLGGELNFPGSCRSLRMGMVETMRCVLFLKVVPRSEPQGVDGTCTHQ